jgi:thiol-disulfide isomerase/thioredoxin
VGPVPVPEPAPAPPGGPGADPRAVTRRRQTRRTAVVVAVLVVAALIGWFTLQPAATTEQGLAPTVSGPTVGGSIFSLSSERGHWVLVNFFASWCGPCRVELPQLKALDQQHPAGLQVVSIDYLDDSLTRAAALIHSAGGTWPLVDDPSAITGYHVDQGLPESCLVNPAGRLSSRIFGGVKVAQVTATVTGRAA